MKKIIGLVLALVVTQNALALDCTSEGWEEGTPILVLTAEPIFKDGQLVALNRLDINYVGPQTEVVAKGEEEMTNVTIATAWADSTYKPRTKKDSVRFNLDDSMEWASENYGGIVHALILPKSQNKIAGEFNAILVASGDPYHNQIGTYYKLICTQSN